MSSNLSRPTWTLLNLSHFSGILKGKRSKGHRQTFPKASRRRRRRSAPSSRKEGDHGTEDEERSASALSHLRVGARGVCSESHCKPHACADRHPCPGARHHPGRHPYAPLPLAGAFGESVGDGMGPLGGFWVVGGAHPAAGGGSLVWQALPGAGAEEGGGAGSTGDGGETTGAAGEEGSTGRGDSQLPGSGSKQEVSSPRPEGSGPRNVPC